MFQQLHEIDGPKLSEIGAYNSPMNLSLRLAVMFSPLLVWGMLYFASRLGGISPTRFAPWLRTGFVVLMVGSIVLFIFDRTRLANAVAIHAWGFYGAELWIKLHYKQEAGPLVTSLKL
jgi:hypothetical protein